MKIKRHIGKICGMKRNDGSVAAALHESRLFDWTAGVNYDGEYSKWFFDAMFGGPISESLPKNGSSRDILGFHYDAKSGDITLEFEDTPQDTLSSLKNSRPVNDALRGGQIEDFVAIPKGTLDEAIRLIEAKYLNP